MKATEIATSGLVLLALLCVAGCAGGPGHTRAAGTLAGTGAGALIGAAASPCNRAGGAAVGAVIGMLAGSMAGEGLAQDQERSGCYDCPPACDPCPPCDPCDRCDECQPQPCPRQGMVRYGPAGPPPPGYYYVGPYYAPCPPPCR